MENEKKIIEDFGNKIGGAKKDLARKRKQNLTIEDTAAWNEQERKEYIKKKTVWVEPDYKKMVEDGADKVCVYFIKLIRDKLPAKPAIGWSAKDDEVIEEQEKYITFISEVRDMILQIKRKEDIKEISKKIIDTYTKGRYSLNSYFTNKQYRALRMSYQALEHEMNDKQFLWEDKEKLLAAYNIGKVAAVSHNSDRNRLDIVEETENGGQRGQFYYSSENNNRFFSENKWEIGKYYVYDNKRQIFDINFDTKEDAKKYILKYGNIESSRKEANRKKRFVPPLLDVIRREGSDYRQNIDANGQTMLDTFNFYGGEFGNWERQTERQMNLNFAYDAFKDLAYALDIDDKDVSLGGNLSLAFGARGSGNALAHYENIANVINLTRMKGAGSLAHEFGHALDSYIAKATGKRKAFATDTFCDITNKVMDAIKYKENEYGYRIATGFYISAKKMDGEYTGYWGSNVELFARAFACYIKDKLAEKGMQNDYLCGHCESAGTSGEERVRINEAFDEMFAVLKERGIFHAVNHEVVTNAIIEEQIVEENKAVKQKITSNDELMNVITDALPDILTLEEYEQYKEDLAESASHLSEANKFDRYGLGISPVLRFEKVEFETGAEFEINGTAYKAISVDILTAKAMTTSRELEEIFNNDFSSQRTWEEAELRSFLSEKWISRYLLNSKEVEIPVSEEKKTVAPEQLKVGDIILINGTTMKDRNFNRVETSPELVYIDGVTSDRITYKSYDPETNKPTLSSNGFISITTLQEIGYEYKGNSIEIEAAKSVEAKPEADVDLLSELFTENHEGKLYVEDFYRTNHSIPDLADFIRNQLENDGQGFGLSGYTRTDNGITLVQRTPDGQHYELANYTWHQVAEAVAKAIDEGRYSAIEVQQEKTTESAAVEQAGEEENVVSKLLSDEIMRGSGFQDGKFRINDFYSKNKNMNEFVQFLKNEYGNGGHSGEGEVKFAHHDGKGIEIITHDDKIYKYSWNEVAKAIKSAIDENTYITSNDIENRIHNAKFYLENCDLTEYEAERYRKILSEYGLGVATIYEQELIDLIKEQVKENDGVFSEHYSISISPAVFELPEGTLRISEMDTKFHVADYRFDAEKGEFIVSGHTNPNVRKMIKNALDAALSERTAELVKDDENPIYEEVSITQADIDILRTLPARKSVLNFTDEERAITKKWAEHYENEISQKSPYYRAENGDWRVSEKTAISVIDIPTTDKDFKTADADIKSLVIPRGNVVNNDTLWNIQISRRGLGDTLTYARRHNDISTFNSIYSIKEIVSNSVLLDTVLSEKNNKNKADNTAYMHKMYSVIRFNGEPYIAKLNIEEMMGGNNDTIKRLYNLQDIKIEPLRHATFADNRLAFSVLNGTEISIAQLFEIVKTCDKDFYLNKREKKNISHSPVGNEEPNQEKKPLKREQSDAQKGKPTMNNVIVGTVDYKDIKVKKFINITSVEECQKLADELTVQGIPFSGRIQYHLQKGTITVSPENYKTAYDALTKIRSSSPVEKKNTIIGNKPYKYIADKKFIKANEADIRKLADILTEQNVQFSGCIYNADNATITVSGAETAKLAAAYLNYVRNTNIVNHIANYDFTLVDVQTLTVKDKNDITMSFDNYEDIENAFNDMDNEFFHPTYYQLDLTSDAFSEVYAVYEMDSTTGKEKHITKDADGYYLTFDTVDDAVLYIQQHNISIANNESELEDWKKNDSEKHIEEMQKLINQFGDEEHLVIHEDETITWTYFNPDGNFGNGQLVEMYLNINVVAGAYGAYKAANDFNEFLDYINANAETHLIDADRDDFEVHAKLFIAEKDNDDVYILTAYSDELVERLTDNFTDIRLVKEAEKLDLEAISVKKACDMIIQANMSVYDKNGNAVSIDELYGEVYAAAADVQKWSHIEIIATYVAAINSYVSDNPSVNITEYLNNKEEGYEYLYVASEWDITARSLSQGKYEWIKSWLNDVKNSTTFDNIIAITEKAAAMLSDYEKTYYSSDKTEPEAAKETENIDKIIADKQNEMKDAMNAGNYAKVAELAQELNALTSQKKEQETAVHSPVGNEPKELTSFIDDEDKMRDFRELTKAEFLESYSYITEAEYEMTEKEAFWLNVPEIGIDDDMRTIDHIEVKMYDDKLLFYYSANNNDIERAWESEDNSDTAVSIAQVKRYLLAAREEGYEITVNALEVNMFANLEYDINKKFADFVESMDFTVVKVGDKFSLRDETNFGDIHSDIFDNAEDMTSRLDIYINDYYISDIAERLDGIVSGDLSSIDGIIEAINSAADDEKVKEFFNENISDMQMLDLIANKTDKVDLHIAFAKVEIETPAIPEGMTAVDIDTAITMWEQGMTVYHKGKQLPPLAENRSSIVENITNDCYAKDEDVKAFKIADDIASEIWDMNRAFSSVPNEVGQPYYLSLEYGGYDEWENYDSGLNEYQNTINAFYAGNFTSVETYLENIRYSDDVSEEMQEQAASLLDAEKVFRRISGVMEKSERETENLSNYFTEVHEGKFKVEEFYKTSPSIGELADFIQNLRENEKQGFGLSAYTADSDGISFLTPREDGSRTATEYTWEQVAKAISKAIDEGRYITPEDIAERDKKAPKYTIYQLKKGKEFHNLHFTSWSEMKKHNLSFDRNNYDEIYSGKVSDISKISFKDVILESIFTKFNTDRPEDFTGHSLSVSDVVVLDTKEGSSAYFVDSFGMADVTDLFFDLEKQIIDISKLSEIEINEEYDRRGDEPDNPTHIKNTITFSDLNQTDAISRFKEFTYDYDVMPDDDEGYTTVTNRDMIEEINDYIDRSRKDSSISISVTDSEGKTTRLDGMNYVFAYESSLFLKPITDFTAISEEDIRAYHASNNANMECSRAIEDAISRNIGSNGYAIDEQYKFFDDESGVYDEEIEETVEAMKIEASEDNGIAAEEIEAVVSEMKEESKAILDTHSPVGNGTPKPILTSDEFCERLDLSEGYISRLNEIANIADKIEDAIDNGEIGRDEQAVSQVR